MSGFVWISSYPKSGNTWVRVFVSNLLRDSDEPARINDLEVNLIASSRDVFEELTGLESSELTDEEAAALRPLVYAHIARHADRPIFCKIHDRLTCTADGVPLVPPAASLGAVYIVRNPLDVAVSFAHHANRPIDRMIDRMADERYTVGGRGKRRLAQRLGSWSSHVSGWVDAPAMRVLAVRYEDLSAAPLETFAAIARFAAMPADELRVGRALRFSSFDELQRQERAEGFHERTSRDALFFRGGRAGGWREALTARQVERIVRTHGEVMRRFGYLDADGEPTC